MKKFVLVLALTLVFVCCASFSVFAAPFAAPTIIINDSQTFTLSRQVNNYPLQVNSPIYTYEPWIYSITDSTYSFSTGRHYDLQFNQLWEVTPSADKGDSLSFNVGIIVVPQYTQSSFPSMTGRLWNIQAVVGNIAYDVEIKQSYSVVFDIPNMATSQSNLVGTQLQYVCYTCVLPLPSSASSFTMGFKCKLNVYEWPNWPIFSLMLCVSDSPIQFSNFDSSTDEWAQVFSQFLTPEELKQQADKADQGQNAGQGASDAINGNIMGGDYGSAAQTGYTDIVKPLLNNPLISVALPIGVVFILLLWGIHKGNS